MKIGILLPIFSLPSKYGIGDFGYEAYEFIDILSKNNVDFWEILPINESDRYPYAPISYYALNHNYISIDKLIDMGLITNIKTKKQSNRIIYDDYKEKYYKEAYKNFTVTSDYIEFCKNKKIIEFAKYMAKTKNEDMKYYLFLQYILDKQWNELKDYANSHNVQIIGDMPIYPCFNSCEVKYNSQCYELENGMMKYVSGASPDYFSSEGQKWGHPLYNFEYIKSKNYEYLIDRYKEFLKRYDVIRIDCFRTYDTYYKIPIDKPATDGFYVEGPGEDFFDRLLSITTSDRFIVEDLGDIRKETEKLRDKYNFPKLKILQYTLKPLEKKDDFIDCSNMVIYTGNHDNNTIIGWYKSLTKAEKRKLVEFLKENNCYDKKINYALIKYCLKSIANIAIFPVQDIIGLDEKSRINIPGNEYGNLWSWKLKDFNDLKNNISILNNKP